jgi:hypothetical protein
MSTNIIHKVANPNSEGTLPVPLTDIIVPNGFFAEQDIINTQSIDTDSGNFRFSGGGSGTAFLDWNSTVLTDHIFAIGVNTGINGDRQYTDKPSFRVAWESRYWSLGKRHVYAQEFGFRGLTTTNLERRLMDAYMPYDGIEYEVGFNASSFSLAHPISRNSGTNYQRVLYDLWTRNAIDYKGIAISGTANGATTNSAGYAIGVTQVTLAATGTGALPVNTVFQFAGSSEYYAVEVAVSNVAVGGVLQFFPPLKVVLPASAVTITRVAVPPPASNFNHIASPYAYQLNNAGNNYLPLPYYNNNDNIVFPTTVQAISDSAPINFKMSSDAPGSGFFFSGLNNAGARVFNFGNIPNNTTWQGEGWIGLQTSSSNGAGIELRSTSSGTKVALIQYDGGNLVIRQNSGGSGTYIDAGGQLIIRNWSTGGTAVAQLDQSVANFNGVVKPPTFTVAALPSASDVGAGARAQVSNALSPVFGATVVTGGAVFTPVYSDGAAWRVG